MSLIRFLSAGSRGLAHGARPMGRYRLPDGRVIPNFGGPRNPFTSKNSPSQASSPPAADVSAKAALTQAPPPAPSLSKPADTPPKIGPRRGLVKRFVSGFIGGMKRVGSVLTPWRSRKNLGVSDAKTFSAVRGPVQGELSLENVRVVRNDLSDSDYEVVCADTATASPTVAQRGERPGATDGLPWSRLAERLFGSRNPQ